MPPFQGCQSSKSFWHMFQRSTFWRIEFLQGYEVVQSRGKQIQSLTLQHLNFFIHINVPNSSDAPFKARHLQTLSAFKAMRLLNQEINTSKASHSHILCFFETCQQSKFFQHMFHISTLRKIMFFQGYEITQFRRKHFQSLTLPHEKDFQTCQTSKSLLHMYHSLTF